MINATRCKSSLLWRNFYNAILASDSEPDIFVSGEAGHEQRMLARYRSPRKDCQIVGWEWMQTLIALGKIGYFLLFSAIFSWRATASQYYILINIYHRVSIYIIYQYQQSIISIYINIYHINIYIS